MPPTMASRLPSTCVASLDLRSLSISTTIESGKASAVKTSIFCSTASSKMRNSLLWRSGTRRPASSLTVTGSTTRLEFTMILVCASLNGGEGDWLEDACGAAGNREAARAASQTAGIVKGSAAATLVIFDRLFIIPRPNFLSEQVWTAACGMQHASLAPFGGILKWRKQPSGQFPAGHLSSRKVYMSYLKKFVALCMTWGLATALAIPALPQEPTGQAPVIKTQVNLVNLFVTVRDKSKRIVTDLKQDDFKVAEDNQDQKIAFFSKEVTLPITLGLLLDTSGSEQYMLGAIQDAGGRFIDRVLRKGDEALVMSFDSDVDLLSDFTDDRRQIERAIRKARINVPSAGSIGNNPGPVGSRQITGTALYDAIYLACNEKLNTEAGRKAIVIVTDAQDEGSKVRLEEAIEAAQRTDTVVHILLVADPRFGGNSGVAHKITEETGGRMISVSSEKKLLEAFDEISEELRSQYTLGYYPSNNAKDGRFRKIKVEAVNRDLKVLTRKGYYAPKS